jgi:hypothetical protein
MPLSLLEPVLHAIVGLALLAAYVTLAILGHDDTALLGILVGQLAALSVSQVAQQAAASVRQTEPPPPAGPTLSPAHPAQ